LGVTVTHRRRTAPVVLQCAQTHRWDDVRWVPVGQAWQFTMVRRRWMRRLFAELFPILFRIGFPTPRHYPHALTGPRFQELQLQDDTEAMRLATALHSTVRR